MVPVTQGQNQSQPAISNIVASQASSSLKFGSNSQTNFFPDTTSNMS